MIILDSCILVFYTIRLLVSDKTIEQFEQDKRSFVNFDPVVVTDTALGGIISFAVFFAILKVFFILNISAVISGFFIFEILNFSN